MDSAHDVDIPPLARRAWMMAAAIIVLTGSAGMAVKGAHNQCSRKWLESMREGPPGFSKDLAFSWWPPGARCTLTGDTGEVRTYHLPWD